MPEEKTLTRYQKDVLESASANHMWLNALSCINPSDDFLMQVGRQVLHMLSKDENLILSDFDGSAFASLKCKELVLRINKS